MNTETTRLTKIDMPNLRIEVRDETLLFVADIKLERKAMHFDIIDGMPSMPSLVGFTIVPIFSKPGKTNAD
jgi:hypothetical protein